MSSQLTAKIKLFAFLFAVVSLFCLTGCGGGGGGSTYTPVIVESHTSPNGLFIAYIKSRSANNSDVWLKRADGSQDGKIESPGFAADGIVWAANSTSFAYVSRPSTSDSEIHIADVTGRTVTTAVRQSAVGKTIAMVTQWEPNVVTFRTADGVNFEANADGTGLHRK